MKVEIWSDIVCPFCYIGKRKFEMALEKFAAKDKVEIEWKSFQLDPEMDNSEGLKCARIFRKKKRRNNCRWQTHERWHDRNSQGSRITL